MIERRCPQIRLQLTEDIDLRAKILPFPNPHGVPGRERKGSGRVVGNPVVMAKILVNGAGSNGRCNTHRIGSVHHEGPTCRGDLELDLKQGFFL